jgi:Family of unknown function (DUF6960)
VNAAGGGWGRILPELAIRRGERATEDGHMTDLPPLATDPKYGYFPWWPEEGAAWFHPEDVAAARDLIPSNRVFRRDGREGSFALFHYGNVTLRAKPTLWQEVAAPDFAIGELVEVRTRGLANEPHTGSIAEIMWDEHGREIVYQIIANGQRIETSYTRGDLKRVEAM